MFCTSYGSSRGPLGKTKVLIERGDGKDEDVGGNFGGIYVTIFLQCDLGNLPAAQKIAEHIKDHIKKNSHKIMDRLRLETTIREAKYAKAIAHPNLARRFINLITSKSNHTKL